jgi:hypothetical protein
VLVSTQAPPHFAKPCSQLKSQTPPLQLAMPRAGASQVTPQALQFCGSVSKSTQAAPHSSKLGSHAMPHFPSVQVAVPFDGIGQAMPQPPQLSGLAVVSMQEPAQFSRPPEQPAVQRL